MIEKITDHNLERYDSRLKEWCDRKFFEKGNYGKYETTEEAGAVAFYPAPDTPLEGKVKFSFKETMPAEGIKGPDNPSTINGISEVKITHGNKNYVSLPYHTPNRTLYDVEWAINSDNSVTAVGTATQDSFFYFTGSTTINLRLVPNRKYFLHGCPSGGSANTFKLGMTCGVNSLYSNAYDYGNGAVFIPKTHDANVTVYAIINSGYSANITFKPQLEDGETGTAIEIVPRNVYTLSLGSTYYGGEIDLATGLMTVTRWGHVFDGTEAMTLGSTYDDVNMIMTSLSSTTPLPATIVTTTDGSAFCTHYPHLHDWGNHVGFAVHHDGVIRFFTPLSIASTAAELKTFFASQYANGTPVVLTYPVLTPPIVALTPLQIFSLSQTDKYTPRLNTVYTDADSIQISYLKSPIRDEYEKTQAILSLGGNS